MNESVTNNEKLGKERSTARRLPFNLICGGISHLLSAAIALFLTPFLLDRLGVGLYGFYPTALEIVAVLGLFMGILGSTAARYVAVEYAAGRRESAISYFATVFWGQVGILTLLLIPSGLFVGLCDRFMEIPRGYGTELRIFFSLMLTAGYVDAVTAVFGAVYTVSERLDLKAGQELASVLVKAGLLWVLFCGAFPISPIGIGVAVLVSALVSGGIRIGVARWLFPELMPKLSAFRLASLRQLAASGLSYSIYELGGFFGGGLLLILAGLFFGADEAGVYSVSLTASRFFGGVIAMPAGLFVPQVAKRFAVGERRELALEVERGERLVGLFALVGVSVTIGFLPEFFGFWLGEGNTPELRLMTLLSVLPCLSAAGALPIFHLAVIMNRLGRLALLYLGVSLIELGVALCLCLFAEAGVLWLAVLSFGFRVLWHSVLMPIAAGRLLSASPLRFYLPILRTYVGSALVVGGILLFKRICVIGSVFSLVGAAFVCASAALIVGGLCLFGERIGKIQLTFPSK